MTGVFAVILAGRATGVVVVVIRPRVHKEIENEDQAQDQIDKFP